MYNGKVDLHLHLDGSLCVHTIRELLNREGVRIPDDKLIAQLSATENCQSLENYLECFSLPQKLLQTPFALELAAFDLVKDLSEQGIIYAEIRFAPQKHTINGMSQDDAVKSVYKGIRSAMKECPSLSVGIILCLLVNGDGNEETLHIAEKYYGDFVAGIDLAGAEWKSSPAEYKKLFRCAAKLGIPFTIHAGESGPCSNIEVAVEMGARRIGHGCSAAQSEKCMRLLKDRCIIIECCPTSNAQTRAVGSMSEHPIKKFYDNGLLVNVNTDNMLVSQTSIKKEHDILRNTFLFTDEDFIEMDKNAIKGAFLPMAERAKLIQMLGR